jgi:hypothetical protein
MKEKGMRDGDLGWGAACRLFELGQIDDSRVHRRGRENSVIGARGWQLAIIRNPGPLRYKAHIHPLYADTNELALDQ